MSRVGAIAGAVGVFIVCSGAAIQQAQSTFDDGGESWTAVAIWSIGADGKVDADPFDVTWFASAGNPDACIGFHEKPTTRDVFVAPSIFLGTGGSAFGSELSFDLTTTRGSGTTGPQPLVTLVGAGRSLTYRAEIAAQWTHYVVPLRVEGWELFIWGWGNFGPPATQDDLRTVLSNLSGMYIWGDFTGEIDESSRLDNVTMVFNTNTAKLTTEVVGGHGTLAPPSGDYTIGASILLTASPDPGYQVQTWTGTDDDTSTALTNLVTITGDKSVTVSFELAPMPPDSGSGSSGSGTSGSGDGTSNTSQDSSAVDRVSSDGSGTDAPATSQCGGCGAGSATLTVLGMSGMGLMTRFRARRPSHKGHVQAR